jgi:hypothetical protein
MFSLCSWRVPLAFSLASPMIIGCGTAHDDDDDDDDDDDGDE